MPVVVRLVSVPTLVNDDVTTVLFSVVPLNVDALATLAVEAYDAEVANDDVNGVNVIDVAADAVVANDAEIAVLASPINDPVKLPVLICKELLTIPVGNMVGAKDAVVENDDVNGVNVIDVAADDVSANDDVNGVNVIDVAADAVFAKDAVSGVNVIDVAADAVFANDAVSGVNVIDVAADDVSANDDVNGVNVIDVAADAVVANELDIALLAVPNTEPLSIPVNEPVNEPVLICRELLTIPAGNIVGAKDAEVAKLDVPK